MNRIVIAVDASDRSEDAVALGGFLVRATGAPVTLAHVHHWSATAVRLGQAHFAEQAATIFRRLTAPLGPVADLETCAVPGPSPVRALQDLAEDRAAGLIVVGSSHTGRRGRVLPGSTAERLLHGAPCPVAVVPVGFAGAGGPTWKTIGCAWNGSADADAGLGFAETLATATGAAVRVIRVVEEPLPYPPEIRVELEAFTAGIHNDARRALEGKVAGLERRVAAAADLRDGEPVAQLVAASTELDALVIGSRGYGPLGAVLLGGVSGRLVRLAHCPVIVHPNGARRKEARPPGARARSQDLSEDVILEGRTAAAG